MFRCVASLLLSPLAKLPADAISLGAPLCSTDTYKQPQSGASEDSGAHFSCRLHAFVRRSPCQPLFFSMLWSFLHNAHFKLKSRIDADQCTKVQLIVARGLIYLSRSPVRSCVFHRRGAAKVPLRCGWSKHRLPVTPSVGR